jgi:hypothetical protein
LTRSGDLAPELEGLLAWVACIADARPLSEYASYLAGAGLLNLEVEVHDGALVQMVSDIQGKLLGVELMSKLKKVNIEGVDFAEAKALARAAAAAVRTKTLGYALMIGTRD